jgi:glutathione S-transferase
MRLLWSSRSPFARKVMIVVHELGIADRIATERVVVNSVSPNLDVMRFNPLGKIPTLILDDGGALFDSRVIIDYLMSFAGGSALLPRPPLRWAILRREALGDGVMEADLRWIDERIREPPTQLPAQIDACRTKILSGLDALEGDDGLTAADTPDLGRIAVASALSHLDFRFAELEWRRDRPRLDAWFDGFNRRPSMTATAFADHY